MEIKEVPIEQQTTKQEKYSEDVRREARRYLSVRGFTTEELTDKQFEYVAKHINAKRRAKFAIAIFTVAAVASMFAAFLSYKSLEKSAHRLAEMIPSETVVIKEDNSRTIIKADPKVVEFYGKAYALMGFTIGFFGFVAVSSIAKIVGFIVKLKMEDPAIEVFLPAKQPVSGGANEQSEN